MIEALGRTRNGIAQQKKMHQQISRSNFHDRPTISYLFIFYGHEVKKEKKKKRESRKGCEIGTPRLGDVIYSLKALLKIT